MVGIISQKGRAKSRSAAQPGERTRRLSTQRSMRASTAGVTRCSFELYAVAELSKLTRET